MATKTQQRRCVGNNFSRTSKCILYLSLPPVSLSFALRVSIYQCQTNGFFLLFFVLVMWCDCGANHEWLKIVPPHRRQSGKDVKTKLRPSALVVAESECVNLTKRKCKRACGGGGWGIVTDDVIDLMVVNILNFCMRWDKKKSFLMDENFRFFSIL